MRTSSLFLRLIVYGIGVGVILVTGCSEDAVKLVYVLPNGFRGTIKLRSEQPNGQTIRPTNGVVTITFGPSGVADVRGRLPTLDWHSLEARYQNGQSIPVVKAGTSLSDETIALRSLGLTANGKESWDSIGTKADLTNAYDQMWKFSPDHPPKQE